jgi:exoribonuclease R
MYKFRIINNNKYIEKNGEFKETSLCKFFDGDIIENNKLYYSEIRNKILVGYLNTNDTTTYGKVGSRGNIKKLYLVKPFSYNLPNFIVAYKENAKIKGKVIIRFKFLNWNSKLPRGAIEGDIIGNLNDDNLEKTLLYHYQIYPKKYKINPMINPNENKIKRKSITKYKTISIDPSSNCQDIDDCISYMTKDDFEFIGIHIAQPTYWLDKNDIKNVLKSKFSTLYKLNQQDNLWGEEITKLSSLNPGEKKPAYSIFFKIYNGKIVKTYDFPSWIKNNHAFNYESKHKIIDTILSRTKNFEDFEGEDTHDLISYWMIKANQYIGNKIKNSGLPFRVNKLTPNWTLNLDSKINSIFKLKNSTSAYYSIDETHHGSLDLNNYMHFTSPIRRIIDSIIHYYLTYNILIDIDIEKLNFIDSNTKKFHRSIELQNKINNYEKLNDEIAYIYDMIKPNLLEVYIESLGFVKLELFNSKFNYQFKFKKDDHKIIIIKENKEITFRIGEKVNVIIAKVPGFLPKSKIKVLLKNEI